MAECENCKRKRSVMKRCTRCRRIYYCSRSCQIENWTSHKVVCTSDQTQVSGDSIISPLPCANLENKNSSAVYSNNEIQDLHETESPSLQRATISVKCNHKKHKINVTDNARHSMDVISDFLKIPLSKLKLIAQGNIVNAENLISIVFTKRCKAFMAFGEECEDESGLHKDDIETIMKQLNVDRNRAVRGLKECDGNLIDAILHVGDKL